MGNHQKKVAGYQKLFDRTVKQNKKSSFIDQNHAVQLRYEACLSALEKEKNHEKAREKKTALNEAYEQFWKKRYLALFKVHEIGITSSLKDEELKGIKRDGLKEIHPDRNQERNQEGLSTRRTVLEKVFAEIMQGRYYRRNDAEGNEYERGLKQDAITRRQQALKQWFWDKAHDPQHRNNESIQIGAYYLWGEEYTQSIEALQVDTIQAVASSSLLLSRDYTPAELNALAIVPYGHAVASSPVIKPPKIPPADVREELLKELEEELEIGFFVKKEHFVNDQIPKLIWDQVFLQHHFNIICIEGSFSSYFKEHPPEHTAVTTLYETGEETTKQYATYPDLINLYEWMKVNTTCPLDRLAKKYPGDARFQLTKEGRFLLSVVCRFSHTSYFRMENEVNAEYTDFTDVEAEVLATQKYEQSRPDEAAKFIDVHLINEFNLRELAWELIVREVNLYQTQPEGYPNKTMEQFCKQLEFIYQGVRLGGLSLKIIYDDLVRPLQELIKQLNREIIEERAEKASQGEHAPLLAEPKSLKAKKRDQVVEVLQEVKKDIEQGIRTLVTDSRRTHDDWGERRDADKKFMANLYKQLAKKLEDYAKSPVIGKHQNLIGHMLMSILGAISGVILSATVVGLALWKSERFSTSFKQTFFGTATQGKLRALRDKVAQASEYLRKNKAPKHSKIRYAYGFLPDKYEQYAEKPKIKQNPEPQKRDIFEEDFSSFMPPPDLPRW